MRFVRGRQGQPQHCRLSRCDRTPLIQHEFPGPSVLARSVGVDLNEVDVVDDGCLASVGVDHSLVLGRRSQMRIDNVNAISTFQHAQITRDNATLPESVVLQQSANGG